MACYTDWNIAGSTAGKPGYQSQDPSSYKSIQVWCSNNNITGVKLLNNDDPWDSGAAAQVGQTNGDTQTISLGPGVMLTSLTMWPSGNAASIVGISATTNDGQNLDIGNTGSKASTAATGCWVGSGILTGIQGTLNTSDGTLSRLGFCFFKPIANMSLVIDSDGWWGGLTPSSSSLQLQTLSESTFTNQTAVDSNYNFTDSVTRTDSRTTENTLTKTWGGSVTLTAGIPDIAQVSTTASWSITQGTNVSNTTSIERALEWSLNGVLPAMTTIVCRASCYQGLIDVWFNCTINVLCKDNSSMSFASGGRSKQVLYSLVSADVVSKTPYTAPLTLQQAEQTELFNKGKKLASEDDKAVAKATAANGNGHRDYS